MTLTSTERLRQDVGGVVDSGFPAGKGGVRVINTHSRLGFLPSRNNHHAGRPLGKGALVSESLFVERGRAPRNVCRKTD